MAIILPQKVLHLHLEEAKKTPKISGFYMITEKLDGWYAYIDYSTDLGWGYVHSRQGREIPSLKWLHDVFVELPTPKVNCRLIFEVTIDEVDFHTTNGILNRSKGDCQAWRAKVNLHDYIETDSYFMNLPENKAIQRWNKLQYIDISNTKDVIRHIPLLGVSESKYIWFHYFNQVTDNGGEGVVLKKVDSLYQSDKRNSSLMKIKLEESALLECVDIYYTTGEKGNSNLNATLRSKEGNLISVRIGKFSDIDLIESDHNYILGKVVQINAMCRLPNGMFREPRFYKVCPELSLNMVDL